MIRFLLASCCAVLLTAGVSLAQSTITGNVTDAQSGAVLPFASVRLFRQADQSLVTGAVTDEKGNFTLKAATGSYYALLEFVGYKPLKTNVIQVQKQAVDLGAISLKPSANNLDEVVVQAEKSSMEMTLDKKVFHVGKDLANAGGTASDILSNVPSVAVDVEGNVSLRGSSAVRILIDGKPSGLVSIKGGSGLQQLQGSAVERIEVITNPSARYEAEGMGGIINIVLKKEKKEGFNGSFDIITGYPTNYGAAANVNYRRKNLNFFVNYSMSYRNTPGRSDQYQEVYRNDSTFVTQQHSTNHLKGMYNNARAGLDYYFDEKNILTASYTYRISKGKRFSDIRYQDYLFNLSKPTGTTYRTQDETETEPNSEYALTYKKTFARQGHELSADVRFLDNWESSDQYFTQKTTKPDGTPAAAGILQHSLNDETEKQWLGQVDYVRPFAKDGKLELGGRTSFRKMTNDYAVTQQNESGGWDPIAGLTNNFVYDEQIHALYGILGNKVSRFSFQAGLRAEWTNVTTTLKQTNDVNPRHYANLFPSVHVTYDLPRQNALQLSYSRRVRRPQYNDLSPFMTYSDSRNYWSGNPDLNPEFTNAFEFGHIKYFEKGSFTSSVYYRHTDGKIVRIRQVDENGNARTRPENLATENSFGAEFTSSYAFFKWWKLDGSLNFFRAITDGANLDTGYKADTYSWFARATSRFTILQGTDFQLRGNYEAPQQTPQGKRKAIATLDIAVSKDVLKNNGTITLNVLDVFNSRRFRTITQGDNFYTENNSQGRLRQINLTFNYRLRQAKKKVKEPAEGEF